MAPPKGMKYEDQECMFCHESFPRNILKRHIEERCQAAIEAANYKRELQRANQYKLLSPRPLRAGQDLLALERQRQNADAIRRYAMAM